MRRRTRLVVEAAAPAKLETKLKTLVPELLDLNAPICGLDR
ncbi:MAG TPA: hypothetical protein VNF29_10495 [Candidatus Binataceae bacterium]|nr:hypothetical protein [Candidatus Binataceae bacterium]